MMLTASTKLNPGGFLGGYLDNTLIGCISAVAYENTFGFNGFYIVVSEYRGQGYGIQLWQAAMHRLAGLNIGLDGLIARQANYQKSGFKFAYRNIRYEGLVVHDLISDQLEFTCLQSIPFAQLEAYDCQCFPATRTTFLRAWITLPQSYGYGVTAGDRCSEYDVIRKCHNGHKIGPLFADDTAMAEALYLKLLASVEQGAKVYLDIAEVNVASLALKEQPGIALSKVFGVTTYKLLPAATLSGKLSEAVQPSH
jgi:Acetyltransferase (GNAT) domain/Acetyltransferase (GNAT) family